MTCHFNTNQKKVTVAVLTSDRAVFRARKIIKDKKRYYMMIKATILQEDIAIHM